MTPLYLCLAVGIPYAFTVLALSYIIHTQGRELDEVRDQNERLIARIGAEYGFTTAKSYYQPVASQPPIGPTPPPMFSFKKDTL